MHNEWLAVIELCLQLHNYWSDPTVYLYILSTIVYLTLMMIKMMLMTVEPCGDSVNFMIYSFCMDSFSEWSAQGSACVWIRRNFYNRMNHRFKFNKTYFECGSFHHFFSLIGFGAPFFHFVSNQLHILCVFHLICKQYDEKKINLTEKKWARTIHTCTETIRLTDTDS